MGSSKTSSKTYGAPDATRHRPASGGTSPPPKTGVLPRPVRPVARCLGWRRNASSERHFVVAAPQNYLAVIKVVGIGGGGVNAVNRMIEVGLKGVGVDRDEIDALQPHLDHAVDGVDTATADAHYLDDRQVILGCCHGSALSFSLNPQPELEIQIFVVSCRREGTQGSGHGQRPAGVCRGASS